MEYVYSGIYIVYKCIRGNNMIEQSVWSNAIYIRSVVYIIQATYNIIIESSNIIRIRIRS